MAVSRSHLVLMGPPGAGKGTQADLLAEHLRVPHISTGGMLRDEAQRGSELGKKAKRLMDRGELVPDEIMLGIVRDRIGAPDCARGYILDGFPRSIRQAEDLEKLNGEAGPLLALSLRVPSEVVIKRLSSRRTCRPCGAMYHLVSSPPKKPDVCDRCGGELYQRDDDREDVIHARLEVYRRETEPLLAYYGKRNALVEVDGTGSRDDVFQRLLEGLAGRGAA